MTYNADEKIFSVAVPWLSYLGMRKCFEGSNVIFQGDSMMRQMFNRLVHYIRGYDIVIEHFYHFDAKYSFNVTHDLLSINDISSKKTVLNPLFTAHFIWDPVLDDNELFMSTLHQSNTLFIVGLHHWLRAEPAVQRLEKFKSNHTLFVTVPTLNTPDQPSLQVLMSRNAWIYKNSNLFIPLNEMTAANAFQTNDQDPYHFQCAYLSERVNWAGWMAPVAVNANEAKFKSPQSGDCRDMINLNIAMLIAYHRMVYIT